MAKQRIAKERLRKRTVYIGTLGGRKQGTSFKSAEPQAVALMRITSSRLRMCGIY